MTRQESRKELPRKPWAGSEDELLAELAASPERGLSDKEVRDRRNRYGSNRLRSVTSKSTWSIFVDQIKNILILLLAAAAVLSFAFGQRVEGISIIAAIIINTAIGFFTELKATRSMESFYRMQRISSKVMRNGELLELPAEEIVPGDMVYFEGGDIITADMRLIEASRLQADESALTGESVPVNKDTAAADEDAPLAERSDMLFKGTSVTGGSGRGLVVATGMETELGMISSLTEEAAEEVSPLEQRLGLLGRKLVWVTLGLALFIAVSGLAAGRNKLLIIETSIALAVAAIPEGLPIVATIALARGMWRMARHNVLVNRLTAVETLGATNVICTDKTGTLTENRMEVSRIVPEPGDQCLIGKDVGDEDETARGVEETPEGIDDPRLSEIVRIGVLCNNASLGSKDDDIQEAVGDPLEVALLGMGRRAGMDRDELLERMPEVREEAFDPGTKRMATIHEGRDGYLVAVKGAPEAVLEVCTRVRTKEGNSDLTESEADEWLQLNENLAEKGLRVISFACKTIEDRDEEPYGELTFLGLMGLVDPPREEIEEAVSVLREAGIRTIMVTGDQAATARYVGLHVGIIEEDANGGVEVISGTELGEPTDLPRDEREKMISADIFARVSPEQKLHLITLHQDDNSIVAMTGDGVNDAPALKKADIGVAMGKRGTQVAREAADIVLTDDSFRSILLAVQQGRAIFDNIRKFIVFLLSGNAGEIIIVASAVIVGATLPLLPLQILYLNIIGDVLLALALGVGRGDRSKMRHPSRDADEPILTRRHWYEIVGYGILIATVVLVTFALALGRFDMEAELAVTVSFLTLAFARMWHVFNMRDRCSGLFRNDITRNPFVWGVLALSISLLLAAVYVPALALVLDLVPPGRIGWTLIVGMSFVPLIVGQSFKLIGRAGSRGCSNAS